MSGKSASEILLNEQYQLLAYLGGGGFGDVFLAEDITIPGRKVAIKAIHASCSEENELMIHEMRMLSKINHPNVVTFYHYFHHGDRLCMVFEYCSRGTICDSINYGEPVALTQVFNWGLTLCEALDAIHQARVIHHDIKPSNILLTEDGTLKLGDFGVANTLSGTIAYLAPEMLDGSDVTPIDPRPDIYALGITLFELLTGRHPFIALTHEEALKSRQEQKFVADLEPRWAKDVLMKATHPIREKRFQTAIEFAEAIRLQHVPDVFDENAFQAHQLADRSEKALARRKWITARKLAIQSVKICKESVSANVAAGRAELRIHNLTEAQTYFERALHIDKRAQVQKELGWIKLESGRVSQAISLLTEHLRYVPDDMEAYNLLLKCFYRKDRYDAGLELLDKVQPHARTVECFRSNRFLFELLSQRNDVLTTCASYQADCDDLAFVRYNATVVTEREASFISPVSYAKPKLLFQEYAPPTGKKGCHENHVAISWEGGNQNRIETAQSIYCIGRVENNDLQSDAPSVSRRHCAIVNMNQEVWLYDLDSTIGTFVDGQRVKGRAFLLGVHEVTVGNVPILIASSRDLLI